MFIDTSALTAMLTDEVDARELLARLQRDRMRVTSPLAIWETTVAVARIWISKLTHVIDAVEEFLALVGIEIVNVPPDTTRLALGAFARYGKGRHRAGLNFGDCFAYACARKSRRAVDVQGRRLCSHRHRCRLIGSPCRGAVLSRHSHAPGTAQGRAPLSRSRNVAIAGASASVMSIRPSR